MVTDAATYSGPAETAQRHHGDETEPADYAKINAVYGALMTGVVVAARGRSQRDPIAGRELVPIAAATFAMSKMIGREKIGSWVRQPFVEQEGEERRPRGEHLQRAVGELVTCTRCLGAWSALGIVGLRLASPESGRIVTNVLAVSAANDWLQAGFKMLTASVNRAEQH